MATIRHNIKMKNGYLIAKEDIYCLPPCAAGAGGKTAGSRRNFFARVIFGLTGGDHGVAFVEAAGDFYLVRAFDSQRNFFLFHLAIGVYREHVGRWRRLALLLPLEVPEHFSRSAIRASRCHTFLGLIPISDLVHQFPSSSCAWINRVAA